MSASFSQSSFCQELVLAFSSWDPETFHVFSLFSVLKSLKTLWDLPFKTWVDFQTQRIQWSVRALLIEAESVVVLWFLCLSANAEFCVLLYHYSKRNTNLRGHKFNLKKTKTHKPNKILSHMKEKKNRLPLY